MMNDIFFVSRGCVGMSQGDWTVIRVRGRKEASRFFLWLTSQSIGR